jgi:UDP-N-acetylmuramoylalanine--D-glutamate ligase
LNPFQAIGVLGDGITAKAVLKKASELNINVVPVYDAAIVIASPGIPPQQFPQVSVPIISELDYAYLLLKHFCPDTKIIAVTGTNGKSTVTSLIAHLLHCPAVGNIGTPFISIPSPTSCHPILCIEASSYQLETSSYFQPDVAVLLNVVEDHLVRHGSMANYCAQKQRLIKNMSADQTIFYNSEDDTICHMIASTPARCIPFISPEKLPYPLPQKWQWGHYPFNAVVGLMVARHFNKNDASDDASHYRQLTTFQFLPHRLEFVSVDNDRRFINDSKSTNPHSTLTASAAFDDQIHVILCGEDKRCELSSFLLQLSQQVSSITVFGQLSTVIMPLIPLLKEITIPVFNTKTLPEAVQLAYTASSSNDIILFSPSSSSYDQFNGFEDRGNQFKEYVQAQFCASH